MKSAGLPKKVVAIFGCYSYPRDSQPALFGVRSTMKLAKELMRERADQICKDAVEMGDLEPTLAKRLARVPNSQIWLSTFPFEFSFEVVEFK